MQQKFQLLFVFFLLSQMCAAQTYPLVLKDINPGEANGIKSSNAEFFSLNNSLLFLADDGNIEYGEEWWISDGTPEGTSILKDIMPGTDDADIKRPVQLDDLVLFFADDGVNGSAIYYGEIIFI